MQCDPQSLDAALQEALRSKPVQQTMRALQRAADDARPTHQGPRPQRLCVPSGALPPLP
jgi:hypothetical protein